MGDRIEPLDDSPVLPDIDPAELDRLDHDSALRVVRYLHRRFPCLAHQRWNCTWTRAEAEPGDARFTTDPLFSDDEVDALQNAIAHWLADCLVKGWDKPDEFQTMIAAGNKLGMNL